MDYIDVKNWETLPGPLWQLAEKQAQRSTLNTFKTGAVIFDDNLIYVSKGTSHHVENGHTKHAEIHALENIDRKDYYHNLNILVVTLGKNGNYAYSSCPCAKCAERLWIRDIHYVFYAERKIHEKEFVLNTEIAGELVERANLRSVRLRNVIYAREMRIK